MLCVCAWLLDLSNTGACLVVVVVSSDSVGAKHLPSSTLLSDFRGELRCQPQSSPPRTEEALARPFRLHRPATAQAYCVAVIR